MTITSLQTRQTPAFTKRYLEKGIGMSGIYNKITVITGGTSGIGRAAARAFAAEGAVICILGRNAGRAEKVLEEIQDNGGSAEFYHCDITVAEEIHDTIGKIIQQYGRIDILFNSAGISPTGTVETTPFSDFKKVMEADLYSIFLLSQEVIGSMKEQGGGNIINIAGTYGMHPVPNKAGYACAKAGVISLTRSIAIDFARQGIRCNAISPGYVDTPLNDGFPTEKRDRFLERYQPDPEVITAEAIANAAVFLASDESRNITGQNLVVDGGTEACLYYLH